VSVLSELLAVTARPASKHRAAKAAKAVRATVIRPHTLGVAGLALLSAAAWEAHTIAGLAAAGLSLLLLEHRARSDRPER